MITLANGITPVITDYPVGADAFSIDIPDPRFSVHCPETRTYCVTEDTLAVMFDYNTGEAVDLAENVDTARSMVINDGYLALVLRGEGDHNHTNLQTALDNEAHRYADCYGAPWGWPTDTTTD